MKGVLIQVNQKGGVGKTSVTQNLGATLAARGERVLLIDLDPQASLTLLTLRPSADARIRGSAALLASQAPATIAEVAVRLERFGVDVVPAEPRRGQPIGKLDAIEHELQLEPQRLFDLGDRIGEAANSYDYVLLDLPPNRGPLTQAGLYAATAAVVPLDCGPGSIGGLGDLLGTLKSVQRINDIPIAAFALVGYKANTNQHRGVAEALTASFPSIPCIPIRDTVRAQVAEEAGVPLLSYSGEKVNDDYRALADAVTREKAVA